MNSQQIENRLKLIGNGACVSFWNNSFTIQIFDTPIKGQRFVASSGDKIDEALFDRAEKRLKEIDDWIINGAVKILFEEHMKKISAATISPTG